VTAGSDIEVFIDDWQSFTGGAIRTWYDGIGYSLVTEIAPTLVGDYNDDGAVDAADYVVWRKNLGQTVSLPNRDTNNSGPISLDDFDSWTTNYGSSASSGGGSQNASAPEPSAIGLSLLVVAVLAFARVPRQLGS
jgi:hypothetical protein